jgi:anaerobic selenocysteine-containing dehydrogenase
MASYVPDEGGATRGAFWLVSAPSVHTHNSTFSHSERHVKRVGEQRVKLNPLDAQRLGLVDGARATLSNQLARVSFPVEITADMPRGLVRIDGLPRAQDTLEGVGVNALVAGEVSDLGDSNTLYSTRVDVSAAR